MTKTQERAARQQIARTHPFVSCAECNQGWVYIAVGPFLQAERCSCWRAHQAKVSPLVAAAVQGRKGA